MNRKNLDNSNPDSEIEPVHFEEVDGETELTPPEIYAANLIEWAVDRRASDLFVSDSETSTVISVRRLGRLEPVRRLAKAYGRKLQGHLRVLGGADAGESFRPVDGRGVVQTPSGRTIDLRLASMPTLYGMDVAVRLFDPVNGCRSLETLGLDEEELDRVKSLVFRSSGLILVAGPVASGKSSTLYAAIDALNDGTRKIHTLEDPIEHALPGVMQTQVNLRAGLDFADLLSAVLRHSPDVIMVGEIRDEKTAATAVRAGASGQLVLATIHAKSAAEAIDSMLHHGTNPKFLAGALIGVVNQRLVRRLCETCAVEVDTENLDLPERILNKVDNQPTLRVATGCDACFDQGYDSQLCVPEIVEITRPLSTLIASGCSAAQLEDAAKAAGVFDLAEVIATKVLRGLTTAEEANRVVIDPILAELALRSKLPVAQRGAQSDPSPQPENVPG